MIKILDVTVPADRIVQTAIAKKVGISDTYLTMLIKGHKRNPAALQRVRKAIIELYTNIITYNTNTYKDNDANGKKILKKTA